jgi:hypothetical protein
MEHIEIIEHAKKAFRWLASGVALPIPYEYAQKQLARGLATRVYS